MLDKENAETCNRIAYAEICGTHANTGWVIKNRTCLSVDNSAMVTYRKASYMSKILECYRQRGPNLQLA